MLVFVLWESPSELQTSFLPLNYVQTSLSELKQQSLDFNVTLLQSWASCFQKETPLIWSAGRVKINAESYPLTVVSILEVFSNEGCSLAT
jgi:hypothetical protein